MTRKAVIPAAGLGTRLLTVRLEVRALQEFHRMLDNAKLVWVSQPEPAGFGDAIFLAKEVQDLRRHGIMTGTQVRNEVFEVAQVIEKPEHPPTNRAVMPDYIVKPRIIRALKSTLSGKSGEVELTDSIQRIIEEGGRVYAVRQLEDEMRLDVGKPESYWEALNLCYQHLALKNPQA